MNYQEKAFAAGKIPGGFFKREGRPSEKETLISRLIDRPIRPLFPEGFRNEVQVVATVLSHDLENDPDIVAHGRLLGRADHLGHSLLRPDRRRPRRLHRRRVRAEPDAGADARPAQLDLVVAGTAEGVLMVEFEAKELSEDIMLGAVKFGHARLPAGDPGASSSWPSVAAKEPWALPEPSEAERTLKARIAELGRGQMAEAYTETQKQARQEQGRRGQEGRSSPR